jgi:dGTP triphosphohydrolase
VLKQISKGHIISTPFIGIVQHAQRSALTRAIKVLDTWLRGGPRYAELPDFLGSALNLQAIDAGHVDYKDDELLCRRAVVDYLCSLTDRQVMELSTYFAGMSLPRTVNTY